MKASTFACVFAAVILIAVPAQAQRSSERSGSYSDRYGVLSDRNIFLKDRSHPSTQAATPPSRSDPELSLKLTGVVQEQDGYRAYVENMNTESVQRLGVGDSVAHGRVAAIEIDAILYETTGGQKTWIEIGNDLANRPVNAPEAAFSMSAASTPTTTPAGMENVNPNDPNLTMEQRLKLRRMQELKGK